MESANDIHVTRVEVSEELVAVSGGGLRVLEIGVVILLGLLVCPPLFVLAAVVAVPALAVATLVAAVVTAVAVPAALVRRVRAHHAEHGSTMFVYRLLWR